MPILPNYCKGTTRFSDAWKPHNMSNVGIAKMLDNSEVLTQTPVEMRVNVSGLSNGGRMSLGFAFSLYDRIAAIGGVAKDYLSHLTKCRECVRHFSTVKRTRSR